MRKLHYLFVTLVCLSIFACKKEDNSPFTNTDVPQVVADEPSQNSIAGIYKNIFQPKCAIPSCHGGTFEPDFRTVESSYNTLVYAPIVKNTLDEAYNFRVIPNDTANSWLFHRVTIQDTLIPRMPIYGLALSDADVKNICDWIIGGAKDMNGNTPAKPNLPPRVYGYSAFDNNFINIDEASRPEWQDPFIAPVNQNIHIWFYVEDDYTPRTQLKVNKLKISSNPNDFSNATIVNAVHMNGPVCWGWVASFNTSLLPQNQQLYLRYYVDDDNSGQPAEVPNINSYSYYKGYYSMIIQ